MIWWSPGVVDGGAGGVCRWGGDGAVGARCRRWRGDLLRQLMLDDRRRVTTVTVTATLDGRLCWEVPIAPWVVGDVNAVDGDVVGDVG